MKGEATPRFPSSEGGVIDTFTLLGLLGIGGVLKQTHKHEHNICPDSRRQAVVQSAVKVSNVEKTF